MLEDCADVWVGTGCGQTDSSIAIEWEIVYVLVEQRERRGFGMPDHEVVVILAVSPTAVRFVPYALIIRATGVRPRIIDINSRNANLPAGERQLPR